MRMSENRILRRIFGPKRKEVEGGWRRLHNEELRNLYASPNVIRGIKSRRMKWAGRVAHMEEVRNASKILIGKSEGKRPLERPRRRWAGNIAMGVRDIEWKGVDWIHVSG
jgi:hypothetical protein